jgi:tripartite-type tricarboxylate transporter receptor subunit TctC
MPRDIVNKLNGYILALLDDPSNEKRMKDAYMEAWKMSADEFAAFVKAEGVKWQRIVQDSGIQPE